MKLSKILMLGAFILLNFNYISGQDIQTYLQDQDYYQDYYLQLEEEIPDIDEDSDDFELMKAAMSTERNYVWNTLRGAVRGEDLRYWSYGLFFIDNNTGWAVGGQEVADGWCGIILKTTDGGANWIHQSAGMSGLPQMNSIYFIDSNTGWAVGE